MNGNQMFHWIASHVEEIEIKKRYARNARKSEDEDNGAVLDSESDENKELKRQKTLQYKLQVRWKEALCM